MNNTSNTINELKNIQSDINKFLKLLPKMYKLEVSESFFANLINLKENIFHNFNNLNNNLTLEIEEFQKQFKENITKLKNSFINELNTCLEENEIKITGQLPKIVFDMFSLEINFEKRKYKLFFGDQRSLLSQGNLSTPEQLAKTIINEVNNIKKPRWKSMDEFNRKLYDIYIQKYKPKEKMSITDLYFNLVISLQSKDFYIEPHPKKMTYIYTRAQFAYDLYLLKQENIANKINLVTSNISKANKASSIWVPSGNKLEGTIYCECYFNERF
ncbi:hypothetical protein ciss_07730 [Carboxydothermus islandicus]|uniref:Uncharacterized protein n=1 Tax=Carboxydothermus islandicus TaxID=661089 RepID=A0A1L8D0Y8_9THEO|nr:hypothetical protein [Carboxydothermus islandicus]GAV24840.1 hypothetical protein ciss_07730 [Carboxydothermus islandicus]